MSSPRYGWWSYAKNMIRRYPELCDQERELHVQSLAVNYSGMPGGGLPGDPTARAALRELTGNQRRELNAVRAAIDETRRRPNGKERLQLIHMIFWKQCCNLPGAALRMNVSYSTAQKWHTEFIRLVGEKYGFDL